MLFVQYDTTKYLKPASDCHVYAFVGVYINMCVYLYIYVDIHNIYIYIYICIFLYNILEEQICILR
jgi:hypothetical protein